MSNPMAMPDGHPPCRDVVLGWGNRKWLASCAVCDWDGCLCATKQEAVAEAKAHVKRSNTIRAASKGEK